MLQRWATGRTAQLASGRMDDPLRTTVGAGDTRSSSNLQAWLRFRPGGSVAFSVIEQVGDVYGLHARDADDGRKASYGEALSFGGPDGRWARAQVKLPVETCACWSLVCGWDRLAEQHEQREAESASGDVS